MYFTRPQIKFIDYLKLFFRKSSEKFLVPKLNNLFPNYNFVFTNSGRSAFQLAIQSLGLENTEMILPAYICDVLKPILRHFNIKPIHIDANVNTFQTEISEIEKQITSHTKSILICHTYGLPIELDQIFKIAKNHNLKIIEDCAHLPIDSSRTELRSDALFFSFSKLFPVISGGLLISKNPINNNLEKYKFKFSNTIRFLRLFPGLARFSEKFRPEERMRDNAYSEPKTISKTSLKMVDHCLDNISQRAKNRIVTARYFQKKLSEINFKVQESNNNTFAYLSALVPENIDRNKLFNNLRKNHIFCSRMWQKPLLKQLPNTSYVADHIINFPLQNWYTQKDINKITNGILSALNSISEQQN